MNKKGNVSWVKPSEPSFLRKFKNDVGYKEGPTVETKRQELPQCDGDSGDSDREDEMPQVVVLKKGDLSAEEATQLKNNIKDSSNDEQPPVEGKILFKKPAKRSSDKFKGITANSNSKKKKNEDEEKKNESGVEEKKKESGVEEKKKESGVEEKKKESGVEEKKKESGVEEKKKESGVEEKKKESGVKVKNSSLLSFGDEEEDD